MEEEIDLTTDEFNYADKQITISIRTIGSGQSSA